MSDRAPRLLFVPVSGAFGMGEYARALAIAQGALARWPQASIRFILSRAAPYAAASPFPATLLDASPTFHSAAVIDTIEEFRPHAVIFDNAGRTAQLRAACRCGARVVYVSARRRQRRKAFRLRWMRLIDEHWIAYPQFIAGAPGWVERLKLKFLRRPVIRYLDVILARHRGLPPNSILTRLGVAAGGYVLVVPGGGTGHPGARDATQIFLAAARELAAARIDTVFVGRAAGAAQGAGAAEPAAAPRQLRATGSLPQPLLADLMRGARLIIANGGSTLLQSIACGKACVAVPIAGDQDERIRRCVRAGVAVAAPLDAAKIRAIAAELMQNEPRLRTLGGRASALGLADGIDVAVDALSTLLDAPAAML